MLPTLTLWAVAAGVWDLGRRRLPNLLTLGGMAAALVWVVFTGRTPTGAGGMDGFLSGMAALALTFPAWHIGVLGAGDVKLAAAMGVMGGAQVTLLTFLLGGLAAGGLALLLILKERRWRPGCNAPLQDQARASSRTVPFGTALAAGFIAGLWMQAG